jgi:hypothetical protein
MGAIDSINLPRYEMALSSECKLELARKVPDTTDIVRDA